MTGFEAVEYLHSFPRMGSGASLTRMQALMARLGNPEAGLKCVHIAGTNGKGTVATLTASILRQAGYKTGLTISPYVLEFRERFQINGEMISWEGRGPRWPGAGQRVRARGRSRYGCAACRRGRHGGGRAGTPGGV